MLGQRQVQDGGSVPQTEEVGADPPSQASPDSLQQAAPWSDVDFAKIILEAMQRGDWE